MEIIRIDIEQILTKGERKSKENRARRPAGRKIRRFYQWLIVSF